MTKRAFILTTLLCLMAGLSSWAQDQLKPCDITNSDQLVRFYADTFDPDAAYQYFVTPSFEPAYALCISPQPSPEQSQWILVARSEGKNYKIPCDAATKSRIRSLLHWSVLASVYPIHDRMGCDGTVYSFCYDRNQACVWSPDKGSNCWKLVQTFDQIYHATKKNDPAAIRKLWPGIDSLTRVFKSFQPDRLFDIRYRESFDLTSSDNSPSQISLTTFDGLIDFAFPNPQEDYSKDIAKQLVEKYGTAIKEVSRWIFYDTPLLDGEKDIFFSIKKGATNKVVKNEEYAIYITINEQSLNKRAIEQLLCETPGLGISPSTAQQGDTALLASTALSTQSTAPSLVNGSKQAALLSWGLLAMLSGLAILSLLTAWKQCHNRVS